MGFCSPMTIGFFVSFTLTIIVISAAFQNPQMSGLLVLWCLPGAIYILQHLILYCILNSEDVEQQMRYWTLRKWTDEQIWNHQVEEMDAYNSRVRAHNSKVDRGQHGGSVGSRVGANCRQFCLGWAKAWTTPIGIFCLGSYVFKRLRNRNASGNSATTKVHPQQGSRDEIQN